MTLREWTVPTRRTLDPDAALALPARPGAGRRDAGRDACATCGEVAAFAADLVSRGRVLPVVSIPAIRPVRRAGRGLAAGARPAADARWAQALALALPPAGRAAGGAPADLVADALDALVDAAARAALRRATSERRRPGPPAGRRRWRSGSAR